MVAFPIDVLMQVSKDFGSSRMLGIHPCRIDAKLTQRLDKAMIDIARLEENHALVRYKQARG